MAHPVYIFYTLNIKPTWYVTKKNQHLNTLTHSQFTSIINSHFEESFLSFAVLPSFSRMQIQFNWRGWWNICRQDGWRDKCVCLFCRTHTQKNCPFDKSVSNRDTNTYKKGKRVMRIEWCSFHSSKVKTKYIALCFWGNFNERWIELLSKNDGMCLHTRTQFACAESLRNTAVVFVLCMISKAGGLLVRRISAHFRAPQRDWSD